MAEETATPEETTTEEAALPDSPEEMTLADLQAEVEGLKTKLLVGLVLILALAGLLVQRVYLEKSSVQSEALIFADSRAQRAALVLAPNGHIAHVPFNFNGTLPNIKSEQAGPIKGMAFYDSTGQPRIVIGLTQEDQPVMAVIAPDGGLAWTALEPAQPQEQPQATPSPEATPQASPTP